MQGIINRPDLDEQYLKVQHMFPVATLVLVNLRKILPEFSKIVEEGGELGMVQGYEVYENNKDTKYKQVTYMPDDRDTLELGEFLKWDSTLVIKISLYNDKFVGGWGDQKMLSIPIMANVTMGHISPNYFQFKEEFYFKECPPILKGKIMAGMAYKIERIIFVDRTSKALRLYREPKPMECEIRCSKGTSIIPISSLMYAELL